MHETKKLFSLFIIGFFLGCLGQAPTPEETPKPVPTESPSPTPDYCCAYDCSANSSADGDGGASVTKGMCDWG